MTRERTARIIGGAFGLFFIGANAGPLPQGAAVALRLLAVAAFVGLFVVKRARVAPAVATRTIGFGRRYWYVVAAELIAGLGGIIVINNVFHAPSATEPWIALVVGLHFFGLAAAWKQSSLGLLAGAMSACGAAGLVLSAFGAPQVAISATAGIAPGLLLLVSVWWNVLSAPDPRVAATS